MKNMLIGFTITAVFVTAVYFGANGEFWNAAGWSLLTFALIMLVIQHENHKAELAKKDDDSYWFTLATELEYEIVDTAEALPTAEELEDPELREFYSLVIEEIKHQNL